jgi:hypothetical protein
VSRLAIALAVCLALGACADTPSITQAAGDLSGRVTTIRQALKDGDVALAGRLLVELESVVDRLEQDGLITSEKAAEIQSAAADVFAQLQLLVSPTVSPSASPTEEPAEEDEDHSGPGHGGDDGDGHAYGHDKNSQDP